MIDGTYTLELTLETGVFLIQSGFYSFVIGWGIGLVLRALRQFGDKIS